MKKIVLTFVLSLFAYAGFSQCGNLVISGIVDGDLPGGRPKAIELYAVCDIADLSLYGLGIAFNGSGAPSQTITLNSVQLTAGSYYYLASEGTDFAAFFGFAPDQTTGSFSVNGDDAVQLFCSGSGEDVFGDVNVDGTGEPWDYRDGWAYRSNSTGPDGTTFVLGNWSFSGADGLQNETTNAGASNPMPVGTFAKSCSGTDVNFTTSAGTVSEDGTSFVISVSTLATGPQTIDVVQTGGTAPGTDYGFTTTTLSFVSSNTATTTVTINDNGALDCDRTVVFELQNPQNGAIVGGTNSFTLTIEDDEVPVTTTLLPGDLVFTGFDNNIGSGFDRIVVTTMVDLAPGTSFIIANAVYESGAAANVRTDLWYACFNPADASIGSQLISYDKCAAGPIAKGSIITFELPGVGTANNFQINGVASSDFSSVDNGNGGSVNISTSNPDAIFLMQGEWTFNASDATFDGRVLGGIQDGATWYQFGDASVAGARTSRVHPDIECLEIQGNTTPGLYAIAYDAAQLRVGDQYDLLSQIKSLGATWTVYTGTGGEDIPAIDYSTAFTPAAAATAGLWRGDLNTNFFDCENWDNFAVPGEEDDVLIPASPANPMSVDATAAFSDRFNDTAACHNFTISGSEARILNAGDLMIVNGDFTLTAGVLNMDGATATDGKLDVLGDWDNRVGTAAFAQGQSTVELRGTADQRINVSGAGTEGFHHLIVNKVSGEVQLFEDVWVDEAAANTGVLTLVQGLIDGNGNTLTVQNENANSVVLDALTTPNDDAYLYDGVLARHVGTGSALNYLFPVGGIANGSNRFQLAEVEIEPTLVLPGAGPYVLSTSFTSPASGNIALNANEGGLVYGELLDAGYWSITSSAVPSSGEYNANFFLRGSTNVTGAAFVAMKRASAAVDWDILGTPVGAPVVNGADVSVERDAFSSFSDFAIARATAVFPVEWLSFELLPTETAIGLGWRTAREQNNAYFLIERSQDGLNFEIIGQVAGAGTTNEQQEYAFLDEQPQPGPNHYRIRQVDLNGSYDWSETLTTVWSPAPQLEILALLPNPATTSAELQLQLPQAGPLQLKLTNLAGQTVWQSQLEGQAGRQSLPLSLEKLPSGMYLLQAGFLGSRKQIRLMVQR